MSFLAEDFFPFADIKARISCLDEKDIHHRYTSLGFELFENTLYIGRVLGTITDMETGALPRLRWGRYGATMGR